MRGAGHGVERLPLLRAQRNDTVGIGHQRQLGWRPGVAGCQAGLRMLVQGKYIRNAQRMPSPARHVAGAPVVGMQDVVATALAPRKRHHATGELVDELRGELIFDQFFRLSGRLSARLGTRLSTSPNARLRAKLGAGFRTGLSIGLNPGLRPELSPG